MKKQEISRFMPKNMFNILFTSLKEAIKLILMFVIIRIINAFHESFAVVNHVS